MTIDSSVAVPAASLALADSAAGTSSTDTGTVATSAAALHDGLLDGFRRFVAGRAAEDDQTLIVIRRDDVLVS